ncbi:Bud site selection protein 6 [Ascosphaera acerosa]|nr:Bud site selection protein 6 [Ascosphaera acerosa]
MSRQPRYSPQSLPPSSSSTHPGPGSFPAPPPPPPPALITAKQADALGLLQRTGELERRASRRFSAYQIQKHLGTPPTGMIPMPMPGLPSSIGASSQPPLPARMGGVGAAGAGSRSEVRESLNAVRLRGAQGQGQAGSVRGHRAGTGPGPGTAPEYVRRGAEEEGSVPFASGSSSSAARAGGMPRSQSTTTASSSSASNPRTRPSGENIATTLNQPPSMERLRQAEYSTSVSNGPESPRKHRPMSPAQAGDGPGDVIMGGLNEATTATSGLGPAVSATHPPYHYTSADPYAQNPAASASSSSLPPQQSRGLTLFLQYKHRIKKYVLPEGLAGLTIGRLQLAFIEKFAWNTHNNGADLPEIYVQDPASGVRHELEDLADVKDRSVLVLNIEPLDEVKRHFDEQVRGVKTLLEGVQSLVETQGSAIQQIGEQQSATAKELAERLVVAAAPSVPPASASASSPSVASASPAARIPGASATAAKRLSSAATAADVASDDSPRLASITATSADGLDEIRSVRRDLAVLRQIYTSFSSDIANSMSLIRKKADGVKIAAATATTPSYEGDAGRAHIAAGKKTLADESEKLVARVDDLQDLVEDLRKDVVSRGVRPLPRQLEAVGRDIAAVTKELKKMQEFLKKEKPIWTKIWEKELQLVCEERDQLTMQEDLAVDLEDDLEKAAQTFALVEQATKQQQQQMSSSSSSPAASPGLHSGGGTGFGSIGMRSISRGPFPPSSSDAFGGTATDLARVKDSVLGEVKALQPNHQTRLDAIERAERARQKELEDRRVGKFQKELGKFVSEGRLKKSGGVDEAERVRRSKDEQIRKEAWEAEMARKAESVASGGSPTKVASPLSQTQTQSQDDEQDGDADNKQTPAVDSEGGEHLGTSDFTESGEKQGQNRGGDAATDPEAAAAMDDAAPEESASSQPGEGTAAGTVAPPAASDS